MKAYTTSLSSWNTPVTEPILGSNQVANNGGGYGYAVSPFTQLERFLILGSEGGTYYASEKNLTKENAVNVLRCVELDGRRTVDCIVGVSDSGRALKNDPALFALALAASAKDPSTRVYALSVLPKVARIPTHLFHFVTFVLQFRGWGRGLKRAIANWYQEQDVDKLAYGMVKYQQRDGWSHRDLLRLTHPKTNDPVRNAAYKWAVDGPEGIESIPAVIQAFEWAKGSTGNTLVDLIHTYNLSREMLPTEALTKPEVWEALLEKMPPHAMLRNLGNMSKVGLLKPLSAAETFVADKLSSDEAAQLFAKNRVHPVAILIALKQYSAGRGLLGKGEWIVSQRVVDALNEAFYLAFKYAEPTGKNFFYSVDVSGSMSWGNTGTPLTPAEGAAAMSLALAKVEKNYAIYGFATNLVDLKITPKMRLDDVLRVTQMNNFGSTNAAAPIEFAIKNKLSVDCFVTITDNDVNSGKHPHQMIEKYRQITGNPAKLVVIAMTPTKFTIADPNDPFSMDVSGFDASVPQAIQEFARLSGK